MQGEYNMLDHYRRAKRFRVVVAAFYAAMAIFCLVLIVYSFGVVGS